MAQIAPVAVALTAEKHHRKAAKRNTSPLKQLAIALGGLLLRLALKSTL